MDRPNFVFILIDDLGWRDLGCYGSTFYETPNLDRLAAEGVLFTDAYATAPVCSPTRASLHTGRYPARLGLTNFIGGRAQGKLLDVPYLQYLPRTELTLAKVLRQAGYATWHVGKWHLGDEPYWPTQHGFDVNIAGCHWGAPRYGYFSPYGNPTLPDGPPGEYLTDRLTDEAINLIRSNDGRPFFLHLAYYAVHIPIQPKTDPLKRFEAKAAALGLDQINPFVEGEAFPCEHKRHLRVVRRMIQSDPGYAAMIYTLDRNIGRLLQALEAEGYADNTVIFFTSDNGGLSTAEGSPTCNLPLAEGKGWMYEGGVRVPLIVKWPGVTPAGAICTTPVATTDFFPTILEMAGLPQIPQQHCDGVSIVPLLSGGNSLSREALFWHYPHYSNQGGTPAASIRCGDYKLIEFFEDNHIELYDLRNDPSERFNLAGDSPGIAEDLRRRLHDWLKEVEARIPQPNPDYEP